MTLGRVLLKVHNTPPIYAVRFDGLASGRGSKGDGGSGLARTVKVRRAIV